MTAPDFYRRCKASTWPAVLGLLAALAAGTAAAQLRLGPAPPALALAPAVSTTPRQADYIVALVNSEPITNNEARARLARIEREIAQQGMRPPPREELGRLVLERLISERAQLQLARQGGIRVEDSMVNAAEQDVARQNQVSVADLHRRLALEGLSVAAFRQDLRNELLLARLREREIPPRVRITEADIDQFLLEQQAQAAASSDINLAHILVAVPEDAPASQVEQLRQKAQDVQRRARVGEDFSALARTFSDAPGAADTGGVIGLRSTERYPPLFVDATRDLRVGAVSEVLRSGAGFHVLKVVERGASSDAATVLQQRARHILLRPGPGLTESQARERLEGLRQQLMTGQVDFATLAREHSQDASARNGGDLGWTSPGAFVPEFEDVLQSLRPGQVSQPIASRFGLHLIQLVERRQQALSAAEQRERARALLRERKQEEAYIEWAQEVRSRAYVEFREPPQQ
jgi:peptidyl-prolyl cis-trans isomerase SurA